MEVDSVEGKTFDIAGNVIVDSGKNPNIIWIIFFGHDNKITHSGGQNHLQNGLVKLIGL